MLACTTYELYFQGQSVLHALKPLFIMAECLSDSERSGEKFRVIIETPEAVTRLYQRVTFDKGCEGRAGGESKQKVISTFRHLLFEHTCAVVGQTNTPTFDLQSSTHTLRSLLVLTPAAVPLAVTKVEEC